jgi:hypothetical protein
MSNRNTVKNYYHVAPAVSGTKEIVNDKKLAKK